MKGMIALTATLALVFGLMSLSAPLHAQDSQSMPQTHDSGQQQDIQTFSGTITKEGDTFVLKDEVNNKTYQLDDQEKAKDHEGKQVRVNGTLDTTTNMIRVSEVAPT